MDFLRRALSWVVVIVAASTFNGRSTAEERPLPRQRFQAKDSLSPEADQSAIAQKCLDGLTWKPEEFEVAFEPPTDPAMEHLVRFPTAKPSGVALNDQVALEWYPARGEDGEIVDAPAVVVVHESGSKMEVGRVFAKAFHARGIHAFMIQLPFYGVRRPAGAKQDGRLFEAMMKQGIADVRRARDAVAVLPHVDTSRIAVQGTSLGGFVAATTAGLDHGFSSVHIMVAGGDLLTLVTNGKREAGKLREMLAEAGYTGDKLITLFDQVEPLHVAHRLNPKTTWMFSATRDQVVPPIHARKLADAVKLSDDHHIQLFADHYTGIVYVPIVVDQMVKAIRETPTAASN